MKNKKELPKKKMYELTEEERNAPITKEIGEQCRHRLEKRWYRRMIELNVLMIVVVLGFCIYNFSDNVELEKRAANQFVEEIQQEIHRDSKESDDMSQSNSPEESYDNNVISKVEEISESHESEAAASEKDEETKKEDKLTEDDIPWEIRMLFYGILLLVAAYLALYYYYAWYRSMSLRITEENFPEVFELVEQYAHRLGIEVPKVYVAQQSGELNAFSTFLFKKQWIMIHSELFEVAYREHKDMDSLAFVIAHEMAHIYYGHATLHYNLPFWFSRIIPVFSQIASRTREYSCDRLAQRLTGTDGIDAMLMLVVDRHLYKMVDKKDYEREMRNQKGFFLWIVNMMSDHPVMCKRIAALADGVGSGKVY
ncbi:MAG: M48 family metallopeptidase [Lachnospiraceae bacterium]|nr:M48 family metallopeptidase [Lachnospiraceae bacterium]